MIVPIKDSIHDELFCKPTKNNICYHTDSLLKFKHRGGFRTRTRELACAGTSPLEACFRFPHALPRRTSFRLPANKVHELTFSALHQRNSMLNQPPIPV